jgi:glutaredoxin
MKTTKAYRWVLGLGLSGLLALGCADRSPSPQSFGDDEGDEHVAGKPVEIQDPKEESAGQGGGSAPPAPQVALADEAGAELVEAKKLLEAEEFEKLLDVVGHKAAEDLSAAQKTQLADIYHAAAHQLRFKRKNVAFSSMFCERGLLLAPGHAGLLRLQVRNYLHPNMNLVSGAEELAIELVAIDPDHLEHQFLRGKVAFEQADWDTAVTWLKRAARVGRTQSGKMVEEAWKLLDLAKGRQEEIKSALSMTRELEVRMKRAKLIAHSKAAKAAADAEADSAAGGGGGPVALSGGRVVLYMTRWCKYCQKTRALLEQLNVKFEEKDIERDQAALVEMMQLAESKGVEVRGVPVVRVGAELVVGYNEARIKSLVDEIR